MSLEQIVQDAANRMGLPPPDSVVASTEITAQRLLALANQSGLELMRRHNWQVLTKEVTFVTIADAEQTGVMPSDFDRFVNETVWNRSQTRRLDGPLTSQEWQSFLARETPAVIDAFRIRGDAFLITPTPAAGQTIAFEYVSNLWVDDDADGDGDLTAFAADSNTAILDEEMITQDVVWRYRKAVGLNYAEDFKTAEQTILGRIAADGGRRTMSMGPRRRYGPGVLVQDGNFTL